MKDDTAMLPYPQALQQVIDASPALGVEACALPDLQGRVSAVPVHSPQSLPCFCNAALDGYALPPGDFPAGAEFTVAGRQAAGEAAIHVEGDAAWEVTTGAYLPRGLSSVAPVEQVQVLSRDAANEPTRIRLTALLRHAQHVRQAGEDVASGQAVLPAGTWLQAPQLMLLSALGIAKVAVARRPKIALISTGRELVDDPAQPLCEGQIRNANGAYLGARTSAAGAELVHSETISDEAMAWEAAMQRALSAGAEVIVSSGAVSMGRHDFVPDALARHGAQLLFRKVAIRPGKPLLFARLANGALYFGLPGNPVACAVGWRFFVEPAVRAMLGLPVEAPHWLPLAADPGPHRAGFRHHLKARVELDGSARCVVSALPGQESFRILPLVQANAWLVLPEQAAYQAGDRVPVYGLGHEQALIGTGA